MRVDEKIYSNAGNPAVVGLLDPDCGRLLDVGCGDGANSRLLLKLRPGLHIEGITHSAEEARLAARSMDRCLVADIEGDLPPELAGGYDAIIFSHVLEHLNYPETVVARFVEYLNPGGQLIIAVPNVAAWRTRLRLVKGDFEYEDFGIFDNTHLRFFTHKTAAKHLLSKCRNLESVASNVEGSIPLWPFRRAMPDAMVTWLDELGCKIWPNLFGSQVLVTARKGNG
jgi:2-polyprenyl-3-methyl-5-hydroxy-6-metoxy-1,4-benzoquinol methylase